jgi:hypothetical protein
MTRPAASVRLAVTLVAAQALACEAVPALNFPDEAGDQEAPGEADTEDGTPGDAGPTVDGSSDAVAAAIDAAMEAATGAADASDATEEAISDADCLDQQAPARCCTMPCAAPNVCCNKTPTMMCKPATACK